MAENRENDDFDFWVPGNGDRNDNLNEEESEDESDAESEDESEAEMNENLEFHFGEVQLDEVQPEVPQEGNHEADHEAEHEADDEAGIFLINFKAIFSDFRCISSPNLTSIIHQKSVRIILEPFRLDSCHYFKFLGTSGALKRKRIQPEVSILNSIGGLWGSFSGFDIVL